ncbi:host attachment protein [Microvirga antarctica]|uniref:baeRF12 domain-containing protein n=1 Tax=Microvirga antarctica TaxID=2819233 RepID=UPI001B310932|nr:host attachment family protein [Microvirga antarctica]
MTKTYRIPHDGLVVISDGRKALFLKNKGDELFVNLQVDRVFQAPPNPPTHLQGTDRPGRASMFDQRSAMGQTDWHRLAEQTFAADIAEAVNAVCAAGAVKSIVVAAPPRALAELRKGFSAMARRCVQGEINKDLTKHPIDSIEDHLAGSL